MIYLNMTRINSAIKLVDQEEKQGIVSILGSISQQTNPPASLRRILSADMSSNKWLAQNAFRKPPPVPASADLSCSSEEQDDQLYSKKVDRDNKDGDMWSIIVSNKKTEELPPPYVHPLVKKASNTLCSKSLEICTESLGSETGSDKLTLSQTPHTVVNVCDKFEEEEQSQNLYSDESPTAAKYNYTAAASKRKLMQYNYTSFPPPIPNLLAGRPSLHMHSHRENGRLVLEAVSVPSAKKLQAHRQDGRLCLTFIIQPPKGENHVQVIFDQREYRMEDKLEGVFDISEQKMGENVMERDEIREQEQVDEIRHSITKQAVADMGRGVMNIHIHRSALMMRRENQNPTWPYKLEHAVASKLVAEYSQDDKDTTTLPQSLTANAYEYFWRTKPAATTDLKNPLIHCPTLKNNIPAYKLTAPPPGNLQSYHEQQELLVLGNCRKARTSLLSWDAYCIATT